MKFLMEIMKESFEIELFKSESAVGEYGMVKVYKIRTVIKMRLLLAVRLGQIARLIICATSTI